MSNNTYRIIIALDIDAQTSMDAYRQVTKAMGEVEARTEGNIQWESTDEWYSEDGEAIHPDTIQMVRTTVLPG